MVEKHKCYTILGPLALGWIGGSSRTDCHQPLAGDSRAMDGEGDNRFALRCWQYSYMAEAIPVVRGTQIQIRHGTHGEMAPSRL